MSFETDENDKTKPEEKIAREALIREVEKKLEQLLLSEHLSEDEKASVINEALRILSSTKGELQ